MKPVKGQKNVSGLLRFVGWLYPLWKLIIPNSVNTLNEVGKAMINIVPNGYQNNCIEVKDIDILSNI
jgi:hypothetical protein